MSAAFTHLFNSEAGDISDKVSSALSRFKSYVKSKVDYLSLDVSIGIPGTGGLVAVDIAHDLSRYGNVYRGLGLSFGRTARFPLAVSLSGGTLSGYASPERLDSFLTGGEWNISGGYILGGGLSNPSSAPTTGSGIEYGLYTPQIGIGFIYDSQKINKVDFRW